MLTPYQKTEKIEEFKASTTSTSTKDERRKRKTKDERRNGVDRKRTEEGRNIFQNKTNVRA